MQTEYQTVVETRELVPLAIAMGIHVLIIVLQLALATYLVASGIYALAGGSPAPPRWLVRLGIAMPDARVSGPMAVLRVLLGLSLILPLLLGAPSLVSLVGGVVAFALLVWAERSSSPTTSVGQWARRSAIGSLAVVLAFLLWEGEDGLALGVALATNMQEWRTHELDWQLAQDLGAPKVGDVAPDFELQDPSGMTSVRLSDFRDQRPVVLVFGSYT